ncbi:hypothetical protein KGF56_000601 [Candida oxycetoniae]|uniref:Uncharacterized protein n=1 Tax=Candida oxycetoniae TaxID=497107 RepID=A0AAI9T0Q4_9ASCO|nr:uncharacterized protein KGF56_000601 [Candida oxycetoniae]KAI3406469.1 hypothetical protein KGF56_000601 [Candida oxycetoniae]
MTHEIYSYTLSQLDDLESGLEFYEFSAKTAWRLGVFAREFCQQEYPDRPIIIDITLANGHQLFRTAVSSGTTADNDEWIRRKYNTVFRFGKSSFHVGQKLRLKGKSMEEALFISSKEYAGHGGSVPIRVKSFDGIVGAFTISGLAQEEDHLLTLKILNEYINNRA